MSLDSLRASLADRYTIERELGQGGMATVYLAHDIKHDRPVAIKVLKPELGVVLGAERFLAEIKVTANLQHPNLLPLFDSGVVGSPTSSLYYVMPYIEGETLRTRLDREQQLPVEEVHRLVGLLAAALDFAHARAVVHRDLKPENILIQAGQPIIADFGIALAVAEAGGERITQTGLSLGTPHYMSPEQAAGERSVDARTDQYSLAALTYEMLTGEPPHTGATAQVVVARLMTETPRSIRIVRSAVPVSLDRTVLRGLEKSPADRFGSCGEFANAMHAAGGADTGPTSSLPRRRALLIGLPLLAAAVWFALGFLRATSTTGPIASDASVAVLPFADLSADLTNGFLGDGIAETLINALAGVSGLRVTGRTSSFALRDMADDVQELGRRLGIATVLEGSVQRAGDKLRITAQLIRTTDGEVLWSQNFDRAAADIFAVQDEVAIAVVTALQGRVMAQGDTALRSHGTDNPAAYDAYLLGRHHWGKRTTDDMVTAARYFAQAIAADSGYAQAWSGLADSYILFIPSEYDVPGIRPDSIAALAEEAARHAITLDPMLGEAWSSLGSVLEYRNEWVAAREAYEKSVRLSPNYPTAHQWYAYNLCVWNRWDECTREMSRARDLDPMSTVVLFSLGLILDGAERHAESEAIMAQAEAVDPDHPLVISGRWQHDLRAGATARWPANYRRVAVQNGVAPPEIEEIARQLADSALRDSALRRLARTADPYTRLIIAQILGGAEAAIEVVRALDGHPDHDRVNATGLMMSMTPALRADPRMQAALQKLGLPRS